MEMTRRHQGDRGQLPRNSVTRPRNSVKGPRNSVNSAERLSPLIFFVSISNDGNDATSSRRQRPASAKLGKRSAKLGTCDDELEGNVARAETVDGAAEVRARVGRFRRPDGQHRTAGVEARVVHQFVVLSHRGNHLTVLSLKKKNGTEKQRPKAKRVRETR